MLAPDAAVEPDPLKLTVNGAWPAAFEEEITAVGGVVVIDAFAVIVMDFVLV